VTALTNMADKDGGKDVSNDENTVAKDIVVTKYKMAAEIVNGKLIIINFQIQHVFLCTYVDMRYSNGPSASTR
jgi:hypothetical protein